MNEKFVPSMTCKYNTALSVNAKLLNLEDCHCTLENHNDDFNMPLLGEYLFI